MTQRSRKIFTLLTVTGAMAAAAVPVAQAKNGADDPVGHNVGDDNGGLVVKAPGADDPANHDANDDRKASDRKAEVRHRHRHRGRHHRASHARHGGKDDGPNHDAGDDRGTR
jgi:hypothetical protein